MQKVLHFGTRRCFSSAAAAAAARAALSPKIILLGPPGVGKGTFAKQLAPHYDIPIVATGDLIRNEIKEGTELGKRVEEMNNQGHLVDDETICAIALHQLHEIPKGFILDGFPRTLPQARTLRTSHDVYIDVVLNIRLLEDVLIKKAISRRVCGDCGAIYNLANIHDGQVQMDPLLPEVEGKCDECSGDLIHRADDTVEVVKNRLDVYQENTFPLIEFYRQEGQLLDFDVYRGLADTPRLFDEIEAFLMKSGRPATTI